MIPWVYQELLGKTLLYDILGEEAKKDMKKLWPQRKRKQIYIDLPRIRLSGPDLFPESERTWWNDAIFVHLWKVAFLWLLPYSTTHSEKIYTTMMKTMHFTRHTKVTVTAWNSWPQAGLYACTRVMPGISLHQEGTHAIPREKCARISSLWDWFVTCLHNS